MKTFFVDNHRAQSLFHFRQICEPLLAHYRSHKAAGTITEDLNQMLLIAAHAQLQLVLQHERICA